MPLIPSIPAGPAGPSHPVVVRHKAKLDTTDFQDACFIISALLPPGPAIIRHENTRWIGGVIQRENPRMHVNHIAPFL